MKWFIVLLFLVITGCKTVTPETIVPPRIEQVEASYDGREKNSGLIDFIPEKGFWMTDNAIQRYKTLCDKYKEIPVGISKEGEKNYLTEEGMVNFLNLNDKNLNN